MKDYEITLIAMTLVNLVTYFLTRNLAKKLARKKEYEYLMQNKDLKDANDYLKSVIDCHRHKGGRNPPFVPMPKESETRPR